MNQPRASFAPAVRLAPPGLSFPIAAALPPRQAGPSSAPLSPWIKSRLTGRNNAQAAVQNESSALLLVASSGDPLPYRQQALLQYGTTIQSLQDTRAPLGTPPQPETDVPLAKSHLDAARLCSQLNQPDQANVHVHAADDLLHGLLTASLAKPLPRGWLWRINYLLGDVNLYQNNRLLALYFYQQADSLNPGFPPTMALVQFLGGTPITPPPPAGTLEAPNTADQPIVLAQTQTSTQLPAQPPIQIAPAAPPPTSVTSAVVSAPRPQSPVPNIASSTPALVPKAQTLAPQAKPQDQAGELYITMKQLSASKMLPMAATAISLAAAVLGIAELAPVATAITLAGMIVDHAVSH